MCSRFYNPSTFAYLRVLQFGPQLSTEFIDGKRAYFTQAALAPVSDLTRNPAYYSLKDLMEINRHSYMYLVL